MNRSMLFLLFLSWQTASAQVLSGEEILKKVDQNLVFDQAISYTTMIISSRSGTRTIKSKNWLQGDDKAFVEYLSPPREQGVKMLKIGEKLWTYTPEPDDRIITIAGHLLRQSVMGSDLSYEDLVDNSKLYDLYEAEVVGEDELIESYCWILELTAKNKDTTYAKRKLWVDSQRWIPLREERYAKSGKLLKTTSIEEVLKLDERWIPKRLVFRDALMNSGGTIYIIDSIDIDVEIPEYRFTKASLRE